MGDEPKINAADRPLIFLDVETTGLDHAIHEIIEIAAALYVPWGERVQAFTMRCAPKFIESAEASALAINGYTPEAWASARPITEALTRFSAVCQPLPCEPILVGHNPRFDLGFLATAYYRVGGLMPKLHHHIIDTSTLAWPYAIAGHIHSLSLNPVCEFFDVSNDGEHTAMRDVDRCVEVYRRMVPWRNKRLIAPSILDALSAIPIVP